MKNILAGILLLAFAGTGCRQSHKAVVDPAFIDSLLANYRPSARTLSADSNLVFWERRMNTRPDNFVNGPEYASALVSSFQLHGAINDLRKADSLLRESNEANQGKEAGLYRSLASLAMLQHRFTEADTFLQKSMRIEGRSLPNHMLDFDVRFEKGEYTQAKKLLYSASVEKSYGYLFRHSKFEHYDGSLDSSISCMLRAADKAGNNKYLKQTALSNAADLYMHKGNPGKAADLYKQCLYIDASDFHSITGLGWIALVHDNNDSLAGKIFLFVHQHTKSPDAILKLEQMAEARNDTLLQKKYATMFAAQAGDSVYGLMYSKYLVDLYTGVLNEPAKAVAIAEKETINRPTPQVYAWYAWSLFCNGEKDEAYLMFKNFVSKKPLEGPELFYIGKLMKGLDKGYNAQQFFKAAWKNRYDLSPAKIKYLENNLE